MENVAGFQSIYVNTGQVGSISRNVSSSEEKTTGTCGTLLQTGENYQSMQRKIIFLQNLLEAAVQGVMVTDQAGRLMLKNDYLLHLFGLPAEMIHENQRGWMDILAGQVKDSDRVMRFLRLILEEKTGETLDVIELKTGRMLECRTRFQKIDPLNDSYRLWLFVDCTEQYRREAELQHLSMHDTLTGIYNRAYFETKLNNLRQSDQFPIVMVMLDVDGLKKVNDQQGHPAGDELLCQAAKILCQACRKDDVIARLGGDEFGILLVRAGESVAERVADRIQGLLNIHNMRQPVSPISLSWGYAVASGPAEIDGLVGHADKVMYENRRRRRGI